MPISFWGTSVRLSFLFHFGLTFASPPLASTPPRTDLESCLENSEGCFSERTVRSWIRVLTFPSQTPNPPPPRQSSSERSRSPATAAPPRCPPDPRAGRAGARKSPRRSRRRRRNRQNHPRRAQRARSSAWSWSKKLNHLKILNIDFVKDSKSQTNKDQKTQKLSAKTQRKISCF